MINRYSESPSQNAEILRLIVAFLAKHKLAANPTAYTVAYEYFTNAKPSVRNSIDEILDKSGKLTNEALRQIYDKQVCAGNEKDLCRINEAIRRVVGELVRTTDTTDEKTTQFNRSLVQYENKLGHDCDRCSLENIVKNLMADTRTIQIAASNLQAKLNESRRETDHLRGQLEKIREENFTDPLTGLTNRKGFMQKFHDVLAEMESSGGQCCVLMIDVDRFKTINDTYGHLIGDKVVQFVAAIMQKQVKGKDTVARFGGDEFVILLPETTLSGALSVGENLRSTIEKTRIKRLDTGEAMDRITVSIGVAGRARGESGDELMDRADAALYRSKSKGRNRVSTDDCGLESLRSGSA